MCILQSPLFTDIQTTPSDEETSVKAGDTKRKLEPSVCPHTLVLSKPSSVRRRNSLPTIVPTRSHLQYRQYNNLNKLIEDTNKDSSLSDTIGPDIKQAVYPLLTILSQSTKSLKKTNIGKAHIVCHVSWWEYGLSNGSWYLQHN